MTDSSTYELARGYWRALSAFDEQEAGRRELRAAGVSEHRILTLYPLDFNLIASGIKSILRPTVLNGLKSEARKEELHQRRTQGSRILRQAGAAVRAQWAEDYDGYFHPMSAPLRGAGFEELSQHIRAHYKEASTGVLVASRFLEVTLRTWWLMAHRAQLTESQAEADELMIWVATALLPDLKPVKLEGRQPTSNCAGFTC